MEQEELGKSEDPSTPAELSDSALVPAPSGEESSPAADAAPTVTESASAGDATPPPLKRGALIEGVVAATSPTQVTLDLGEGREGVIPSSELEKMDPKRLAEDFAVGRQMRVVVINGRGRDGRTIVSYIAALEEADWDTASEYANTKEVYNGRVGGYNKGGLIVRFGRIRGFVPQSQISESRLRGLTGETPEARYAQLINQTIDVKVMEVDRPRNRLILSERAAEREARQARKQGLITELQVGEEREGVVTSLEPFGAFVDIGGAEGLIHTTELTHQHITHARQAVSVGEKVRVRVIGIDTEKSRIALSRKVLLPDPWDEIAVRYPSGTLIRGTITKLTSFGAFARIEGADHVEGLVHISELSTERIEDPKDVVKKGDVLTLRVLRVDIAEKRLALSLRAVFSSEYLDQDLEMAYAHPELVAVPERPVRAPRPPRNRVEAAVAEAREEIAEAREELAENIAEAREALAEALHDPRSKVSEAIAEAREEIAEARQELAENIAEAREALAEALRDPRAKVGEAIAEMREEVGEAVVEAREKLQDVAENVGETLGSVRERLAGKSDDSSS